LFGVLRHRAWIGEELLRYEAMTGLIGEQLTDLVTRVHVVCGDKFVSRGRLIALGRFRSVAMVVCLMRKNVTQDFLGAVFGVSQPTVSRRWDQLRPVIGDVLADVAPDPHQVVGQATVLVDGTVCPTWDWDSASDLFSAEVGYPGMNLQIAATLDGALVAVGAVPIPGARHDAYAYAFAASGLAEVLDGCPTVTDLGYVGVDGIDTVPFKKPQGRGLHPSQLAFNTSLSKMRAAVEHAIAHLKDLANPERRRRTLPCTARKSTRAYSRQSSGCSSSRPTNKPPSTAAANEYLDYRVSRRLTAPFRSGTSVAVISRTQSYTQLA
jgi:hypothetical protein